MEKRYEKILYLLLVLCLVIVNSKIVHGQASINEIISSLQNDDWIIRSKTINKLIYITPGVGRGIRPIYKGNRELRDVLIEVCENELHRGPTPGEAYAEYVSMLVSIVASFRDERTLSLFLDKNKYFAINSDAERILAEMGGNRVINTLLEYLNNEEHKTYIGRRATSLKILGEMLKNNKIHYPNRDNVKQSIIKASNNNQHSIRLWALRALGNYQDNDIIPIIKKISINDIYFDRRKKKYLIREEAKNILKRFNK